MADLKVLALAGQTLQSSKSRELDMLTNGDETKVPHDERIIIREAGNEGDTSRSNADREHDNNLPQLLSSVSEEQALQVFGHSNSELVAVENEQSMVPVQSQDDRLHVSIIQPTNLKTPLAALHDEREVAMWKNFEYGPDSLKAAKFPARFRDRLLRTQRRKEIDPPTELALRVAEARKFRQMQLKQGEINQDAIMTFIEDVKKTDLGIPILIQ